MTQNMNPNTQPLEAAIMAADTMMRKYAAADLPPKGHFHYHQGVFLSGMLKLFHLTGDHKYFDYVKEWIDSVFDENGAIKEYAHADLDDIMPGILLFDILDETKDSYYEKCIESVWNEVLDIPKNRFGGFYHKVSCTEQMWLDGLYMAGPFISEYARRCNKADWALEVVNQVALMREKTRDLNTGLWYHAYDASGEASWSNPENGGCSNEFWGRSLGWVPVAILDDMAQMDPASPLYEKLKDIFAELMNNVERYQSEDGRFYQVINKKSRYGNWPENSCTCLFANAMARGAKKGLLPPSCLDKAKLAYQGVINSLSCDGDDLLISGVCIGTGVGDFDFYIARPTSVNDLHGVGAFLLMCTALQE